MIQNEITVYLNEEEAKQFVLFQKHFKIFNILLENKVFEQKAAQITLNFNATGLLTKIDRHDIMYLESHKLAHVNEKL